MSRKQSKRARFYARQKRLRPRRKAWADLKRMVLSRSVAIPDGSILVDEWLESSWSVATGRHDMADALVYAFGTSASGVARKLGIANALRQN